MPQAAFFRSERFGLCRRHFYHLDDARYAATADSPRTTLQRCVVSLFGGEFGVAIAVDRLQIARMVDLGLRPAAQPRLGLADDVVNLVGGGDAELATHAVGTLAQSAVAAEYLDAQFLPLPAIAALVAIPALGVGTPAGCGARLRLEQLGA